MPRQAAPHPSISLHALTYRVHVVADRDRRGRFHRRHRVGPRLQFPRRLLNDGGLRGAVGGVLVPPPPRGGGRFHIPGFGIPGFGLRGRLLLGRSRQPRRGGPRRRWKRGGAAGR